MFPSGWGLYDLYRRNGLNVPANAIAQAKKAGKQHDWNDMEILAQGIRIRLVVNGKQVLDWRDPQPELVGEGPIALQLHSNNVSQELRRSSAILLRRFCKRGAVPCPISSRFPAAAAATNSRSRMNSLGKK